MTPDARLRAGIRLRLEAGWFRRGIALAALAALGGCGVPPITTVGPPRPVTARDTTIVHTTPPRPRAAGSRSHAPADSLPSADALAVLSTLPEPLAPGMRVAPPVAPPVVAPPVIVAPPVVTTPSDTGATSSRGAPGAAASDSTRAPSDSAAAAPAAEPGMTADSTIAPADSAALGDSASVPTPSPTPMLGENPNPLLQGGLPGDTAGTAPVTPGGAASNPTPANIAAPGGDGSTTPTAASSGASAAPACWRVQILAPKDRATAQSRRSAAESLLLTPMVIEPQAGLFKIRTRDCFDHTAADLLRDRAVASGFSGAFTLEPPKPAAPAKPAARKPAHRSRTHTSTPVRRK